MRDADFPTIEEAARRLRAGKATAVDLPEGCPDRIGRQAALNAFLLVMAADARRQARQADTELRSGHDRGPLHGVPISIKDLIDVEGTPTTAASRVREGHLAVRDAPIVNRL